MKTMRKLVEEKVMALFREGYEEGVDEFHEPFELTFADRLCLLVHPDAEYNPFPVVYEDLMTRLQARVKCAYDSELLAVLDAQLCQKYR